MKRKPRRVFTEEDFNLLTHYERAHFMYLAIQASAFEFCLKAAFGVVFVVGVVAAFLGWETVLTIAGICLIGFAVVEIVGSNLHYHQFSSRLFEAVDKHKERAFDE